MWLLIAIAACIVAFQVQVFDTLLKEHYHKGGGWKRIAWDALMTYIITASYTALEKGKRRVALREKARAAGLLEEGR